MRGESDRSAEIGTLVDQVIRHYVFPDIAEEICRVLRERLDAGAYRALADEDFAAAVTEDLQSFNGDKHLRLRCSVEPVRHQSDAVLDDRDRRLQEAELAGHGFAKVERLAGNVGLLDVRALFEASVSGAAAVAAMNLVASADVLLIDLRRNGGGDPAMVALLCSYLFDEPTHLNDLYFRSDDSITQYWTHAFVPGAKFGGSKPVYVLTSGETFSGAEELCYNLQQLRRASLVGETTRGGAHPGNRHRIADHLVATVPSGRAKPRVRHELGGCRRHAGHRSRRRARLRGGLPACAGACAHPERARRPPPGRRAGSASVGRTGTRDQQGTRWSTTDELGHQSLNVAVPGSVQPSIRCPKTHPRYHDMLTKLRRMLIAAQNRADPDGDPTPGQIHAIHLAWAGATA